MEDYTCPNCGEEELLYNHSYYSEIEPYYQIDVYKCTNCGNIVEIE